MKILCFGEILFDIFGNEAKIGGAPLNFSAHFHKLGGESYVVGAVGIDELGDEAIKTVKGLGISTKYINPIKVQTGFCNVTYDANEPNYDLSAICAYDNIELSNAQIEEIENEKFDILYFGTLAQRRNVSKSTLKKLLNKKCFKKIFFDMNLLQNYYTDEILISSLHFSDIVKINRYEFEYLKRADICVNEKDLCEKFDIELLLITLDMDGVLLYNAEENKFYMSEKPKNKVISTVGAGDACSACFLYNYLNGVQLQICVDRANLMGDYIVTFKEAIPEYTNEFLKQLFV